MPLRPARSGRGGVIRAPVAKTAVVAAAVTPEPAPVAKAAADPLVRVVARDSRAWITAGTWGAGVLSVRAWITSPRTRGSGSSTSASNLVHTRSSPARMWQVHRFWHASWRARLSSLRDSSRSPSRASSAVRLSSAGRLTPIFSAILLNRPTIWTIAPAGCPDQGLSRRLAEPSDPQLHRVTRSGQADRESCGRPAQWLTLELGSTSGETCRPGGAVAPTGSRWIRGRLTCGAPVGLMWLVRSGSLASLLVLLRSAPENRQGPCASESQLIRKSGSCRARGSPGAAARSRMVVPAGQEAGSRVTV